MSTDEWSADMDRLIAEMRSNPTRYVEQARKEARKGTLKSRSATTGRFFSNVETKRTSRRKNTG